MTTARKQLISIEATSYYHCVSRCNHSGHIWSPRRLQGRIHLIWMRIGYLNHKYP